MPAKYISNCLITIDGQAVTTAFMADLIEAVVEQSLYLPSMFTLRLRDPQVKWVDAAQLDLGKAVEISVETGNERGSLQGTLIAGEITALEPSFAANGATELVVRGYDKAHRLHRGRQTRSFLKQTDSAIVQKIAGEVSLSATVDATSVTHEYVLQNNQTNMEFLAARAARLGYQLYSAEGTLYFKASTATLGAGPELTFGETLTSFRPRLSSAGQANTMKVQGWNPKTKQAITSQATPNSALNQGGVGKTGGAAAQSAFGTATDIIADQPVFTTDEAAALVKGFSDDISREFIEADGDCAGDPRVKAAYTLIIKGVGTRFSGKYFVTAATHVYNQNGYSTHFTISGRQPNTLSHLLAAETDRARGTIEGVVIGLVTNVKDPDNLGRIKVKYPWLADSIESDWVRLAAPMSGPERGFLLLPEVNDEVLLAFEHGDVHHPYIIGALWNNSDKPPQPNSAAVGSDGKVNLRTLKTRAGHVLEFNDTSGEEQIAITSKSGHTFVLLDKSGQESITVKDKTGNNKLVIDSAKNSLSIDVAGDFTVTAKGKITLSSTQDMKLEATTKATIKGTTGISLDGTTQAELKGATVSVAGSAMTEIKGGLVKIN